jgi:hypothetical protein
MPVLPVSAGDLRNSQPWTAMVDLGRSWRADAASGRDLSVAGLGIGATDSVPAPSGVRIGRKSPLVTIPPSRGTERAADDLSPVHGGATALKDVFVHGMDKDSVGR